MTPRVVWQDGVRQEDGCIHLDADDATFLLGRGVFETLRTYDGTPFRMAAHLARLEASAASVGVPFPGGEVLSSELMHAAEAIGGEAVVRVTLTHGGHRIVRATPLVDPLAGYRCATRVWTPPSWLDGSIKHTSRAHSVLVVEQSGADEVLWVDATGHLLEGTRSNVFAVRDGALLTPPLDGRLLEGVTRGALLALARELGVVVHEQPMHHTAAFDELYLSSTLKELSPIVAMNGVIAPGGGPLGARLSEAFVRAARAECSQ
jgi:branched-chain amino acid aminotransferase